MTWLDDANSMNLNCQTQQLVDVFGDFPFNFILIKPKVKGCDQFHLQLLKGSLYYQPKHSTMQHALEIHQNYDRFVLIV